MVDDLHLLQKAKINPHFLIVGHSLGGMTVRLFATTYPNEVVGMVLVDPTMEDQTEGYRALDSERRTAAQWHASYIEPDIQQGKTCVAAAPNGFTSATELFKNCISEPSPHYSAAINASNQQQEMRLATQQAGLSETEHAFASSADQVRASPRSMGNLPLIVLTRGSRPPLPQPEAQVRRIVREKMQVNLHVDVAKFSTQGTQKIIEGSGHFIQMDKPQAVIDAISTVLAMAMPKQ
jgi:pimeloyl-ACP methyl ester carboxylesterase